MADGHLGYVMPIGGVAAYRDQVSVVGVGFDIACGNAAIRTDLTLARHARPDATLPRLADEIQRRHLVRHGPQEPSERCADRITRCSAARRGTRCRAIKRAGPARQGAFAARHGRQRQPLRRRVRRRDGRDLGRRPLRQPRLRPHGRVRLPRAAPGRDWGARVPEREVLLSLDQPMGQDYWALMTLAGEYAYAGREWVARKVVSILGGRELELVHNHHNFAWREEHDGRQVDRRAQGRDAGVSRSAGIHRRIDGRRCGDRRGRGADRRSRDRRAAARALFSTVHGAGPCHVAHAGGGKAQVGTGKVHEAGRGVAGDDARRGCARRA